MDFHFAKHLSPLVLASEREMGFDCAAIAISHWALWLPCQWPLCTGQQGRLPSLNGDLVEGLWHGPWELPQSTNRCSSHSQPCVAGCCWEGQLWFPEGPSLGVLPSHGMKQWETFPCTYVPWRGIVYTITIYQSVSCSWRPMEDEYYSSMPMWGN